MIHHEASLKKELNTRLPPVTLLFGEEAQLISAYRTRILSLFEGGGAQVERVDGQKLDVGRLYEDAQVLPLFGGLRVLSVEDLEPETLSDADCKQLCALLEGMREGDAALVLSCRAGSADPKKGPRAKKLLTAAEKAGVCAALDRRSPADLRKMLRDRCRKGGCELENEQAALLLERCGEDMGRLKNECDKLIAYADGRPITAEMIHSVCAPHTEGDFYALAGLLLKGRAAPLLREVGVLLEEKQSAVSLLAGLSGACCDLYRAACARAAGKGAAEMAKDLRYRFEWRARNAFRDSTAHDGDTLLALCELLAAAELRLKSGAANERALLESTLVRALGLLRGQTL